MTNGATRVIYADHSFNLRAVNSDIRQLTCMAMGRSDRGRLEIHEPLCRAEHRRFEPLQEEPHNLQAMQAQKAQASNSVERTRLGGRLCGRRVM